jgi:hypothetical protein
MSLEQTITEAWEQRSGLSPTSSPPAVREAVEQAIADLNAGRVRVAEKIGGQWVTHQWLKKAVLLSFRLNDNLPIHAGELGFYDKVQPKFAHLDAEHMRATGVRVVPPAVARRGCFIARDVVLMPSYVNIGAYVDEGTMVDTWATVGSCAQIGKHVHLSGGVGIGGVLEPLQANPTIIEDNCAVRGGRRRHSRRERRARHGRLHRAEHQDIQSRDRRSDVRARTGRRGGGGRLAAFTRVQPLLRGYRQAGRRPNPGQDQHQRVVAHLKGRSSGTKPARVTRSGLFSSDRTDSHTTAPGRMLCSSAARGFSCRLHPCRSSAFLA